MIRLASSRPLGRVRNNAQLQQWAREIVFKKNSEILVSLSCVTLLVFRLPALWSFVLAALMAIIVAAKPLESERTVCVLDFAMLLFYASSCLSTVFAYNVTTALPQLNLHTLFLILYLTFRWVDGLKTTVATAFAIGMAIHCIEGSLAFARSYIQWSTLRFTSLSDFRSSVTLTPTGVRPGNHAAIYLVGIAASLFVLGITPRSARIKTFINSSSLLLSLLCVLLSLSRALYICTFACVVISTWGMWGKVSRLGAKAGIGLIGGAVVLIAILVFYAHPLATAVGDTALFATRLSQSRSLSGRFSVNRVALRLALHSGWVGAGLGNYALYIRRSQLMSPSLLTAHTFNVGLQVAIEQGLLGIISLFLVIAGMVRMLWQQRRNARCRPLLGGAAALCLFSFSQSFIFADQATTVALAIFCALVASSGDGHA